MAVSHGTATLVKSVPAPAGGDGLKTVFFTFTGSTLYDAGGSVIDLSSLFGGVVYNAFVSAGNNDYQPQFVPGTSYATTDCKVRLDDVSGTAEVTGNQSAITFYAVAFGTDA